MFDNDLSSIGFYSAHPSLMANQYQTINVMSSSFTDGTAGTSIISSVKLKQLQYTAGCDLRNKRENGLPIVGIPGKLFLDNTLELADGVGSRFSDP